MTLNSAAAVHEVPKSSERMSARFDSEAAFADVLALPLQLIGWLLEGIDKVALVDYPEYANVGDSLIWLGQCALFKRLKKKIVYVDAAWHSDDIALQKVVSDGAAIIIMGGGNFGTLWPHHQDFREHLLEKFPDATIIQMPQSIYFGDGPALAKTQALIAARPKFHLFARDFPSLSFAKANFRTSVQLCPDTAFFLGPIKAALPIVDVVYLRRSDKESLNAAEIDVWRDSDFEVEATDWLRQNTVERLLQKIARGLIRFRILRNTNAMTLHLYNALAWVRARRGIRIIERGRCIVTDRLHAHILSILLGRENVLLDNSNGKVFAFYEAWTQRWLSSHKAASVEDAFEMAQNALHRTSAGAAI